MPDRLAFRCKDGELVSVVYTLAMTIVSLEDPGRPIRDRVSGVANHLKELQDLRWALADIHRHTNKDLLDADSNLVVNIDGMLALCRICINAGNDVLGSGQGPSSALNVILDVRWVQTFADADETKKSTTIETKHLADWMKRLNVSLDSLLIARERKTSAEQEREIERNPLRKILVMVGKDKAYTVPLEYHDVDNTVARPANDNAATCLQAALQPPSNGGNSKARARQDGNNVVSHPAIGPPRLPSPIVQAIPTRPPASASASDTSQARPTSSAKQSHDMSFSGSSRGRSGNDCTSTQHRKVIGQGSGSRSDTQCNISHSNSGYPQTQLHSMERPRDVTKYRRQSTHILDQSSHAMRSGSISSARDSTRSSSSFSVSGKASPRPSTSRSTVYSNIIVRDHARAHLGDNYHNTYIETYIRQDQTQRRVEVGPTARITDAALAAIGVWAVNEVIEAGTSPSTVDLFPSFRRTDRPNQLFSTGTVLKMLWLTPEGVDPRYVALYEQSDLRNKAYLYVKAEIRIFIVVRNGDYQCSCVPIFNYGSSGARKPGVETSEHGIVYTGRDVPGPLRAEMPMRTEEGPLDNGLRPRAIRLVPDKVGDGLDVLSRVDYGSVHTLDHRVRVKRFGQIHADAMMNFISQFWAVWSPEKRDNKATQAATPQPSRTRPALPSTQLVAEVSDSDGDDTDESGSDSDEGSKKSS